MIAILIPFYNNSKYIQNTFKSILDEHENVLILIRDDCSSEKELYNLKNIINLYNKYLKIFLTKNENNIGVAKTREKLIEDLLDLNKSIKLVCFLDSDDTIYNGSLSKRKVFFTKNKNLDFFGGQINMITEKKINIKKYFLEKNLILLDSFFRSPIISGVLNFNYSFLKEKKIKENNFWLNNLNLDMGEDWAWFCQNNHYSYKNSDDIYLNYYIHNNNMTSNLSDGLFSEVSKIRKNNFNNYDIALTDDEFLLFISISPCIYWNNKDINYFINNKNFIYQKAIILLNKMELKFLNHFDNKTINVYKNFILNNIQENLNLIDNLEPTVIIN